MGATLKEKVETGDKYDMKDVINKLMDIRTEDAEPLFPDVKAMIQPVEQWLNSVPASTKATSQSSGRGTSRRTGASSGKAGIPHLVAARSTVRCDDPRCAAPPGPTCGAGSADPPTESPPRSTQVMDGLKRWSRLQRGKGMMDTKVRTT